MSEESHQSSGRWQRVEQIYRDALERQGHARAVVLDGACAGDAALRDEVESLLACEPAAAGFIESPALEVVADILSDQFDSNLVGSRIGSYVVGAWLGSGGMGDVYRAHDNNLHRDVALKILTGVFELDSAPSTAASGNERLARFKREAQVLASLNHPNIAAIYGFEEGPADRQSAVASAKAEAGPHAGPNHVLVLELVEGPTLADRIGRGPIPLDESLPIARQIATGLEAAHEHGIVHRDLKPANIKLRPDGTVKVLDFGLAKVLEPQAPGEGAKASPVITSPSMLQRGAIFGTAAYMSPEQARGLSVDKRSDVWAFGVVLYEMLSGHRAFEGENVSDTLAAVLRQEVDWTLLPAATPASVRRLLARCLDRDVKRRLRDIGEARIVLEDPAVFSAEDSRGTFAVGPWPSRWRRATPVVLAAIVAAVVAGAAAWYLAARRGTSGVVRLSFTLPEGQSVLLPANRHPIALSPDGSQMVYVANRRLYLRSMSELDAHAIQSGNAYQPATEPVFSPDGRSIAFWAEADQTIKRIPVTGGTAVTICPADNLYGLSWGTDGRLVFGQGSKGIMRVSENGGTPEVLVRVGDGEQAHGPQVLPDGQHLLFTIATGTGFDRWDRARIVVQSLASGERHTLIEAGSDARYVPTGHLLYALGGTVFAVAFDVRQLKVAGGPVAMVEGVRRSNNRDTGAVHFSTSLTGSLIYIPGPFIGAEWGEQEIVQTDLEGGVERLKLPPRWYRGVRVSRDGTRIVFGTDDGKEAIVYTYELSGASPMRRLTFGGKNRFPIWTSNGTRVAFQSDREGDLAIFWQAADGNGIAERLTTPLPGESHAPESWSPKGDMFLFSVTKAADVSLWAFSLRDRKATPFGDVHSSYPTGATFSPDGSWVAYAAAEDASASTTIYVQPFPATGVKHQLYVKALSDAPPNTPHKPMWSPDGRQLYYVPRLFGFEVVKVTTQPTFGFGNAVTVPRPFGPGAPNSRTLFDITPDGKFVGIIPVGQREAASAAAPQIQVVLNWFDELRTRVPTR